MTVLIPAPRYRHLLFKLAIAVVLAAFALPLYRLFTFAIGSTLYSHILLIPIVSAWFCWQDRFRTRGPYCEPRIRRDASGIQDPESRVPNRGTRVLAIAFALFSALALIILPSVREGFPPEDALTRTTLAFVLMVWGVCAWFLDPPILRARLFPIGFLLLMVPLPSALQAGIDTFLQHGSAEAAFWMFQATGTTLLREGLVFHLPGVSLQVAPQCSGIHSTLVLFITSLVAGKLLLRSGWKRALLTFAVIPLALLRNGLRVWALGTLCTHYGPDMLHSWIHRQGGPFFFALSLIPLFLLLLILWKSERRVERPIHAD